jgi:hypothetical protein
MSAEDVYQQYGVSGSSSSGADDMENDIYSGAGSNYDWTWSPVSGVDDLGNALSTGSSSTNNFWNQLGRAILGNQGANGMGAGLALGLGALAAALTRQQAPEVKQPEYKAAPVYNRALTAPMFPPQPAPQKSASGQNIYTPMKGMPLFFNPNPFQFDATEAAKRYGPTPEQIAQGQAGYEAGLASLYKPISITPITFQGASTVTGGAGNDTVAGGGGNSTVVGNSGSDTVQGGATGGSVDDIFVGFYEGGDVYAAAGRYLEGPGDGMSDSIKAQIDHGGGKTQPARLARGEFVVPADVVSDLGNGSSNAGAQKLYDMMKKIRKARHGTSKQPPAVKTDKAMPA